MKIKLSKHNCNTSKCKREHQDSIIVIEPKGNAKGKKYVLDNGAKKTISYFDIDDCVFITKDIPEGYKLCDNVIIIYEIENNKIKETDYVWIELKGTDLNIACEQILNSFTNAIQFDKIINHYARVVLSRVNKKDESKDFVKRLKKQFKKRFDYSSVIYNKDKSDNLYIK